jgi:hypothetical protein
LSEVCAVTPREEAIKAGNQEAAIRAFNLLLSAIVLPERRGYRKGARPQCPVLLLASADKVIE